MLTPTLFMGRCACRCIHPWLRCRAGAATGAYGPRQRGLAHRQGSRPAACRISCCICNIRALKLLLLRRRCCQCRSILVTRVSSSSRGATCCACSPPSKRSAAPSTRRASPAASSTSARCSTSSGGRELRRLLCRPQPTTSPRLPSGRGKHGVLLSPPQPNRVAPSGRGKRRRLPRQPRPGSTGSCFRTQFSSRKCARPGVQYHQRGASGRIDAAGLACVSNCIAPPSVSEHHLY